MRRWIVRLGERIDAMALRERILTFLAMATVLAGLLDATLLQPRLDQEKQLSEMLARRQGESRELQDQLQKILLARQADPDKELRSRLASAQQSLAVLDKRIAEEQRKFTAPDQMRRVLEEMLARNNRLRMVDLKTLPPATIAGPAKPDDPAAKPRALTGTEKQIFRHGVEFTLKGTYFDLLAYLTELERLPTRIYWGKIDLRVEEHPLATLKLTVYTLSFERAWLRV